MVRAALSARRAMETLNFLAVNPRGAYTLTELSQALQVSPGSMSTVLGTLTGLGYLVRHPTRKTYELGPALVTVGHAASRRHPAIDLARGEMKRLAGAGYEVVGSTLVGDEILMAAIEGRPKGGSHDLWLGQRLPLVPPFGRVFTAWMSEVDIDRWLERQAPDVTHGTRERLLQSNAHVRSVGYTIGLHDDTARPRRDELIRAMATRPGDTSVRPELVRLIVEYDDVYSLIDVEPETRYTIANIAAPVFDFEGRVVFGLTIMDPGSLLGSQVPAVVADLIASTQQLTRQIGGRTPESVDRQSERNRSGPALPGV